MSKKSQVLRIQARQIVARVYDFMKKEAINKRAEKLTDARWRTAQAVGISRTTVTRILRERRANALPDGIISDLDESDVHSGSEDTKSTSKNLVSPEKSSVGPDNKKCEIQGNSGYSVAIKIEPNIEEGSIHRSEVVTCNVDVKCEFESNSECNTPSKTDIVEESLQPKLATDVKLERSDTQYIPMTGLSEQLCIVKIEPTDEDSIQEETEKWKISEESSSYKLHLKPVISKDKSQKCTLKPDLTYHGGEKPYKCNVCGQRYRKKDRMLKHFRYHTGEKPYQCKICHKRFTEYCSLSVHIRTHTGEKPYKCNVCEKRFSIQANLVKHMRIHTGLRPYECSICQSRFTQKGHLQGHIKTHTGEKPYECDVCQKRFISNSRLKLHRSVHSGQYIHIEKPVKKHECHICHSRFRGSINLKTHLMTHTGEKPYECDICHKRCSQKSNLRTHILSHSGEKYHTCHICQTGFTRNFTLQKHLRLHLL